MQLARELDTLSRYRTPHEQQAPAPPKPAPGKVYIVTNTRKLSSSPRVTKMAQAQGAQPGQSNGTLISDRRALC